MTGDHAQGALADGDPAADSPAFRRCLGQFATGVTVMTATVRGKQVGVTANSFSSLSLDPPLVLWSIARSSRSFAAFEKAEHFAVNILAADQIPVSQRFASASDDKFSGVDWRRGETGAPVLAGVAGLLECSCEARHPGGDHLILVGRVRRFARFSGNGLVFAQGRYATAATHPDLQGLSMEPLHPPAGSEPTRMASLIFQAYRAAWSAFDLYRDEEDLTFVHGLCLFALWQKPAHSMGELADRILLPQTSVADVCADLVDRMLVVRQVDGTISLTESGRKTREKLRLRAEAFEQRQLAQFPAAQIETVSAFLSVYAGRLLRDTL